MRQFFDDFCTSSREFIVMTVYTKNDHSTRSRIQHVITQLAKHTTHMKCPCSQEIRLQKPVYAKKWHISLKLGQIAKMKNTYLCGVFLGGTGKQAFNEIRPAIVKRAPLTDDDGRHATWSYRHTTGEPIISDLPPRLLGYGAILNFDTPKLQHMPFFKNTSNLHQISSRWWPDYCCVQ
jgi:hypothetical protein